LSQLEKALRVKRSAEMIVHDAEYSTHVKRTASLTMSDMKHLHAAAHRRDAG
jgi:hypothetical protein